MAVHFHPQPTEKQFQRFWRRVNKTDSCWLWTGTLSTNGYGFASFNKRAVAAHRVAYTALVGPIPNGLDLDHLCRVRACVNPAHLEPVTRAENLRRSELTGPGKNIRKTHCNRGHDLSDALISTNRRGVAKRYCRICRQQRERAYKAGTCPKCGRFVGNLRPHLARVRDCVSHPRARTSSDRRQP